MDAFNVFTARFLEVIDFMKISDYQVWNNLESLSKATMSKIRCGRNGVSMNVLYEFCNKFNVNANYILTGEGSPLKDTTAEKEEILRENKNSTKKSEYMQEERIDTKSTMNVLIKTIEYYQKEVERLVENIDELTRENEMMKIELERKKAAGE